MDVSGWNFLSSGCQWMSVDGTYYQMIVSGCQWMAVDGSGCQWMCKCHLCVSTKLLSLWASFMTEDSPLHDANCRSQLSCSSMKQPSPRGNAWVSDQNYLHDLIDKVSILETQDGDQKIRSDDLSKRPSHYCLINSYKRCVSSNHLSLWVLLRTEESPPHAKSKP